MNQDRKFSSNVISSNTFWLSWLNMYMAGWPKTSKQKHWAHYTSLYIRLYKYTQANIQRNWPPLWNIEPATMQYTVTPTHHIILIYLQTLNCCLLSTNIATAVPKHFSLSNIFQQLNMTKWTLRYKTVLHFYTDSAVIRGNCSWKSSNLSVEYDRALANSGSV